jgi:hypothetical protein
MLGLCQTPGLCADANCRVEWERRSYVAEESEPCLGVLARHQVYITIIQSKIDR